MRDKWFFLFLITFLLLPPLLQGQTGDSGQTFLNRSSLGGLGSGSLSGLSLLDPSKLSMSQSYTLSYSSSGNEKTMVGLYMNTLNYRFSDPLSLTVHVGYMHQPFANANSSSLISNSALLSGFELEYKPWKNFFLKIEYGSLPLRYHPYGRDGYGYDW